MRKGDPKKILSNVMWLFWGFIFSPLKIAGVIKIDYNPELFINLPKPIIIAANHRHPLDPFTIGVAIFPFLTHRFLPLTPYAAPLHRLQRPGQRIAKKIGFLQSVYFTFNVSCIPEGVSFSEKIAPLVNAIQNKQSVLIFPEGRAYDKLETQTFKNGLAELHRQTRSPIIPCAVYYYKTRFFYRVVVSLGKPMEIPELTYKQSSLEVVSEQLRKEVEALYRKITKSMH